MTCIFLDQPSFIEIISKQLKNLEEELEKRAHKFENEIQETKG